jgi:membrane-bound lytic murein transglycosylase D
MILAKLERAGLPSQLSWLPLVESAFQVRALSRASALGLWQFISSTGLRYQLRRDDWVDERLDPEKATDAALAYLTNLHRLFGDWPKALAAYNCGEGSITRVQSNSPGQFLDFWDVYAVLPNETRRYVPRLLAVLQIVENPQKFGITLPEPDPPVGESTKVAIRRAVRLEALDAALQLQPGTLAQLNPELRHGATPGHEYELKVPRECTPASAEIAVASLPEYSPPKPEYEVYRVRPGETLSVIAARYHASVLAIVQLNGLRSSHRIWAGQRLRIPLRR